METQLESGSIKQEQPVQVPVETPILENTEEAVVTEIQEQPKSEDIITRVSKYVEENKEDIKTDSGEVKNFNYEELENKIANVQSIEEAKQLLKNSTDEMRKSYDSGFGKKFIEIADLRKELQQTLETNKTAWTPERIRSEMNKPDFIQSAQTVANSQTQESDEYSALSDNEKAEMKGLRDKITQLEKNNYQTLSLQQDDHLKSKYANYDSNAVDILTTELLQGKVQATREHLWKVRDYDSAVTRAYELGRRDERSGVSEKLESVAAEGIITSESNDNIKPEENENDTNFWNRLGVKNLHKLTKAANLKR